MQVETSDAAWFKGQLAAGSTATTAALVCHVKANEGLLYPLRSGLFFMTKPVLFVPLRALEKMQFSQGSATTRYFEFEIETGGKTWCFGMIDKKDQPALLSYSHLVSKQLVREHEQQKLEDKLKKKADAAAAGADESAASAMKEDGSEDDDEEEDEDGEDEDDEDEDDEDEDDDDDDDDDDEDDEDDDDEVAAALSRSKSLTSPPLAGGAALPSSSSSSSITLRLKAGLGADAVTAGCGEEDAAAEDADDDEDADADEDADDAAAADAEAAGDACSVIFTDASAGLEVFLAASLASASRRLASLRACCSAVSGTARAKKLVMPFCWLIFGACNRAPEQRCVQAEG